MEPEPKKRKATLWAGILLLILLLLFLLRGCGPKSSYPVESDPDLLSILLELREELEWPGIHIETAAANLETPEAVVEFVRDGTVYLSYPGSFAAPEAVLRTRSGNSVDRARLTQALLEELGYETRLRQVNPNAAKPANPISGSIVRQTPAALQKLADYLDYDLSKIDQENSDLKEKFKEISKQLKEEQSEAFEQVAKLVPDLFSAPSPTPKHGQEDLWVWPEYRAKDSEEWIPADPTYDGTSNALYQSDISFPEPNTTVQIEGIRGDGSRINLMSWSGEAVGQDVEIMFLPADRTPQELLNIREPNEIWSWAPILQVGSDTVRGNPFTPEGAVLSNYDGSPASFFNKEGEVDFYAPQVEELTIAEATCGDGKRVRVRLNASTIEEPRWHTGHFELKDNGKPVRQLRMEKAGSQPRPVILVVDLSGSMTGVREKMARSAVTSLVKMLPDHQRLGMITHSYGTVNVMQELAPKGEGKAVEKMQGAIFWSQEQILPATLAALEMADEPATIISLTDGEDSMASIPEYPELLSKTLQALRETDSTFIHVGIGEADPVLMNQLADASGTSYLELNDPERLPDLYSQLGRALSGNVELSYVIPEDAEPGTTRELTVEMEGYKGSTTTPYKVKEGTPFGLVRIEVNVSGNPNFELNRTLVDFTDGYEGWRMMTKASLWVSPSVYPPHIVESRRVDEWIEALLLADFAEGSDLDHNELNRSFSFRQGSTLNRIRAWHTSISPDTPLPLGPTVWMTKESLRVEGEDIVKRSDLDWVGGFDWPATENREELAESFLGLLSAEGIVWGGESVNTHLLANTGSLVAYPPGASLPDDLLLSLTQLQGSEENSVIVVDPENPSVGWRIDQETGGVYGYVAHGHEIAKGATLEETAAEFRELRSLLQLYSYIGGGGLSATFSPAGGMFSALCAYFDQILRLYCYSTLMMQQVGDAIESGGADFDPEQAKATAEKLCETSGDPDEFARNLVRETGYGFVRGTAENVAAAVAASQVGEAVGAQAGGVADAVASGATSTTAAAADPTPGTAADLDRSVGLGNGSAVSNHSFSKTVDKAIFGE